MNISYWNSTYIFDHNFIHMNLKRQYHYLNFLCHFSLAKINSWTSKTEYTSSATDIGLDSLKALFH